MSVNGVPSSFITCTKILESSFVPFPNCPDLFPPTVHTVPSSLNTASASVAPIAYDHPLL